MSHRELGGGGDLKVAVLNLTSGGLSGGYRRYLLSVLPRLVTSERVSDLLVALPAEAKENQLRILEDQLPESEWLWYSGNRLPLARLGQPLKRRILRFRPDVLLIPTARYVEICEEGVPTIVMLRNMEPIVYDNSGNSLKDILKNRARTWVARRAVAKADHVIAVSQFVKDELIWRWGTAPEKVAVVHHGVELQGSLGAKPPSIPGHWSGQFFFTAGSIRPARGLEDVLVAIKKTLEMRSSTSPKLVIAGGVSNSLAGYEKLLCARAERYGISPEICWTGDLCYEEMIWCYRQCLAFVMTSRVEACPNIALEAMANRCVCLSADNPPLPEVFNSAAFYYPAKDGAGLAELMHKVMGWDDDQRRCMRARAAARAADFSWDTTVNRTLEVLEGVLAAHR